MNSVSIECSGIAGLPRLTACRRFVKKILRCLGKTNWDVSIRFCDDAFIRSLNSAYRKKDAPTDVLAFSQIEGQRPPGGRGRIMAGDIVISLDTLKRNAENYGMTVNEELKRLLIHGLLHLAGRDHLSDSPDDAMIAEQERLFEDMKEETII